MSADLQLSEQQQAAYEQLAAFAQGQGGDVITMFGYAGTGKTTVLSKLAKKYDALLCTLTGKAASILHQKTGLMAGTLHSIFYRPDGTYEDEQKRKHVKWKEILNPGELNGHLVLLDECMMVGESVMGTVLRAGARVIACGDPNQLWPVMAAPYFNTPDIVLTEIHRQALESPIIRQAHTVRLSGQYETKIRDGAFMVRPRASDEMVAAADIMLCWTHKQRNSLNLWARRLQGHQNLPPQSGEPVMCLKNVHAFGIYNGGIYTLRRAFNPGDPTILIDVDGHLLEMGPVGFEGFSKTNIDLEMLTWFTFGYACTVHKAAGSEWSNVLLFDSFMRRTPWDPERRRWLYTAITRAADQITVIV